MKDCRVLLVYFSFEASSWLADGPGWHIMWQGSCSVQRAVPWYYHAWPAQCMFRQRALALWQACRAASQVDGCNMHAADTGSVRMRCPYCLPALKVQYQQQVPANPVPKILSLGAAIAYNRCIHTALHQDLLIRSQALCCD